MQFNYKASDNDCSYLGRIFLLIKRNYWLLLPDIIVLMILVFPPYTIKEASFIISILLLILIRDIIILKLGLYHMGKFFVKGNDVYIDIIKRGKVKNEIVEWLPDIEMEVKRSYGIPFLSIYKRSELLFRQYPVGIWSAAKMNEFVDSFYEYKKEQALWKIFKGQ